MKRLLVVLLLVVTGSTLGQNISVEATSYTPQQLIEDILINSPCISNVTVTNAISGDFGSSMKSYGYFDATGTTFPFQSGIVMSTGRLNNVPGPNTSLSDDDAPNWGGDSDLNETLGINNTLNATVLEFDFTPTASSVRFNYIFASEEYQENNSNTCIYSDVFAFLIKPVGGTYTNIAVVPNTTTPIKVTTVHPDIPGGCNAENEEYFDTFNGASAPINFNGQTAVLTAEANVTPNVVHHIKLVIADEQNYRYDSAVFLEAESFNTSAELGPDRTIANGNPLCDGEELVLTPNINNTATAYAWYKQGIQIPNETSNQYTVTEAGTYSVAVQIAGGCMATDEVVIEYATSTAVTGTTLSQCDDNEDGLTVYNLTNAEQPITNANQDLHISGYYLTETSAMNGTNPISNPSTYYNTSANQIVYARVTNQFGCASVAEIALTTISGSIRNAYLYQCDSEDDPDGFAQFNLSEATSQITSNLPNNINIAYFATQEDAFLNQNALANSFTNTNPNSQTLYVRAYNQTGCYGIGRLFLRVYSPPRLPEDEELVYCADSYPQTITLYAGNTGNTYYNTFLWNTGETTPYIHIDEPGTYTVTVTNNHDCSATRQFIVTESSSASISYEITGHYGDNNVTLFAEGSGDYLFALDDYNFQTTTTYYHLSTGKHTAYVTDINGCGISQVDFYIVDFPKYFTPNNDGVNDTWHILGDNPVNTQLKYIYIYDRYGKLLHMLSPTSTGWDGTYHNKLLPSDDYWFKAIFLDNKTFNSNFSLIR